MHDTNNKYIHNWYQFVARRLPYHDTTDHFYIAMSTSVTPTPIYLVSEGSDVPATMVTG